MTVRTNFTHVLNKPSCAPTNQSESYLNTVTGHQSQFLGYNYRITGLDKPLALQEVMAPTISRQSAH